MDTASQLSTVRRVVLLSVASAACTIWGVCTSLLPPFYPNEAESKGATLSQSGFVFGVYSLAGLISSPFFSKYGSNISPRYLYIPGALVIALCTLVFGALHFIENLNAFLCLSYILRILSGMANATAWGALMAALLTIFPDNVSKVVAASEFFFGTGFMLGPAVGALFYNFGGFVLPFVICGSIAFALAILMVFVIPPVNATPTDNNSDSHFGTRKLLRIPGVILPLVDTFFASFGVGLLDGTLGIFFQSMGANLNIVSIGFSIGAASYLTSTVIVGYIGDKISNPILLSITGNVGMIVALLIIGPLPFVYMKSSITFTYIGIGLYGFFDSFVFVTSFTRAENSATQNGFVESTRTYQLISGLWIAFDSFGNFLGPSLGGIVVEQLGFRNAIMVFWFPYICMLLFNIIEVRNLNREYQSID